MLLARRRRRALSLLMVLTILNTLPSCITYMLWDDVNHLKGKKVTATLLTPVTVAIDVALIAGYVYVVARAGGGASFGTGASSYPPSSGYGVESLVHRIHFIR
jgi:hypothetical protein